MLSRWLSNHPVMIVLLPHSTCSKEYPTQYPLSTQFPLPPWRNSCRASFLATSSGRFSNMAFTGSYSILMTSCPMPTGLWFCISCYTVSIIICRWTGELLILHHVIVALLSFVLLCPLCRLRLVMPPLLFFVLSYPFTQLGHLLFPKSIANGIIAGAFTFYILYDCMHYALHHTKLPQYMAEMKKYHLAHHYKSQYNHLQLSPSVIC